MQELGYDPNADTLRPRSGGGPQRPFSPTAATTGPTKPATSPTRPATSHGRRDRRTPGGRSSRSASASFRRPRNGVASCPSRWRAPIEFRPVPPPAPGTAEWSRQIDVLIKTSGTLTDKEKAEAEYWGIFGMAPAPQLIEMTKFVSHTNDLRLDDDVKLFFVASNAIFDASIAAWDAKYAYDYVRPITAIRALGDTMISAWRPRSLSQALAYSTPAAKEHAEYSVVSGWTSVRPRQIGSPICRRRHSPATFPAIARSPRPGPALWSSRRESQTSISKRR